MKKLFLTSGVILCMACPAFAENGPYDIKSDNTYLTNDDPATCQYPTLGKYTGPQTFYAKWKAQNFKVTYVGGTAGTHDVGGSYEQTPVKFDAPYEVLDNSAADLGGNAFSYPGYTFVNWEANRSLSDNSVQTATLYNEGAQITNYKVVGNVTMTAQWTPNKAKIALDSNLYGGENNATVISTATSAGTTEIWTRFEQGIYANNSNAVNMQTPITTITAPTLTGYTFNGYKTGKSGDGNAMITIENNQITFANNLSSLVTGVAPGETIENANTTLYAYWTANTYNLYYDCGSVSIAAANSPTGEAINHTGTYAGALTGGSSFNFVFATTDAPDVLDPNVVCKIPGYTASAWSCTTQDANPTSVDYTTMTNGDTNGKWAVASGVTCTVTWTQNTIGLSWDVGTGSARGTAGGTTCTYDSTISVEGAPTRPGYDFQGWTTNPASVPEGTVVFTGQASAAGTSNP